MSKGFYIAGDEYAAGKRKQYMSRIMRGIITGVDNINGIVTVEIEEAVSVDTIELSFDAFSLNGNTSAWFRFMPQIGSVVLFGYRPSGKLELLRYSPIQYERLSDLELNNQFTGFRTLQPGEFDLRSSGGAGFYATEQGEFIVSAGPARSAWTLATDEARHTAGLSAWSSSNSVLRFGDVKRNFVGYPAEHTVPVEDYSEFSLSLVNSVTALLKKVVIQVGDIIGVNSITPVLDVDPGMGLPLRGRFEFYDEFGTIKTSMNVSTTGDVDISISELALTVGMRIVGLLNNLLVRFLTITLNAVTDLALRAGATIQITAPSVTIDGTSVVIGGGIQGLVTEGAIPSLIAHRHVVVPDPTSGVLGAQPSPELTGLLAFKTIVLRSN